jgi:putative drug exporter of the RND superfamily
MGSDHQAGTGMDLIAAHYDAGAGSPLTILTRADRAEEVLVAARRTPGVTQVRPAGQADGLVQLQATLAAAPGSQQELSAIERLRDHLHDVRGADAMVGGDSAIALDLTRTNTGDAQRIIPLVLAVVLVILAVLLFEHVFGWQGQDAALFLQAFVFLVALGVDDNIFLMSRIREEAGRLGTRAGALEGLAVTGSVITSAGLVLAGTFAVWSPSRW